MSKEQDPFRNPYITKEQYEREKVTRIMPTDLKKLATYKLRIKTHPRADGNPFAIEFPVGINDILLTENEFFIVTIIVSDIGGQENSFPINANFSMDGFMINAREWRDDIVGMPSVFEVGYFAGSTDPFDIELAELIQKSQKLASIGS